MAGRSGIARIRSFDTERIGRHMGGEVSEFRAQDHIPREDIPRVDRCGAMGLAATLQALADANLPDASRAEASVVFGTTMGEGGLMTSLQDDFIAHGKDGFDGERFQRYGAGRIVGVLADRIGTCGPTQTLNAACAAGNYAMGTASDWVRTGRADVVIVCASEMIVPLQFAGFVRLAAMSPDRCRPFDRDRQGIILGEGAAAFVMESEESVVRRGATPLAEIGGWALSCDAFHVTRPHPEAEGTIAAMREAILRSGITTDQIDFINAHGTGTKHNDAAEATVVKEVFGARRVPLTSNKSQLGHCMGAASALEAIACLETLDKQMYPPTLHFENPDPECDLDVVANVARPGKANVVLNNSLAFGGYNAVVCLAKTGVLPAPEGAR